MPTIDPIVDVKPGVQTSELYLSLITMVGTVVATALGKLDADTAGYICALISGLYTGSRAYVKKA